MKPTRQTQPYRAGGSRGASQVLDRMRAGKAAPGVGTVLTNALRKRPGGGQKRLMPRNGVRY